MRQIIVVKNMVCPRCIAAVKQIFQDLDIVVIDLQLGKVEIDKEITLSQKEQLQQLLKEKGFELLDDKQTQIINAIKSIIIQNIHYPKTDIPVNISTLLTNQLPYDYPYLSRLFSAVESKTIERFAMTQKIEKVKELLTYDELTLSEISFQLNYSSSAHLSAQFKKVTGMTPSAFKQLHQKGRQFIDEL